MLSLNNAGYGGLIDFQQAGDVKSMITGNETGMYLMAAASRQLYFWTEGNEKMRIQANGTVGIGHASPTSRLEVAGQPTLYGASGTFHTSGGQSWGHVLTLVSDHPEGDDPRLLFSYRANAKHWSIGGSSNTNRFGVWENSGDGIHGTGFGVERLAILPGGDIGIGTSDTRGYKLAVAGNVIAESIKVRSQSSWPDFVFTKNYKLLSLIAVEKHINLKGHLPGIPSAEEVKAHGIDLGEMNAKLLQKIEELTLYLIEKEKQVNKLEKRLKSLEDKSHK